MNTSLAFKLTVFVLLAAAAILASPFIKGRVHPPYTRINLECEAISQAVKAFEIDFGKGIQKATGKPQIGMESTIHPLKNTLEHPGGGSTDVGDVSWNVANINLGVTTAPAGTPWHSWAVVACGGMSIGHKGLIYASKAMAMTMVDLFESPTLVEKVKTEFKQRKGEESYEAMIPDGPPPVNNNGN